VSRTGKDARITSPKQARKERQTAGGPRVRYANGTLHGLVYRILQYGHTTPVKRKEITDQKDKKIQGETTKAERIGMKFEEKGSLKSERNESGTP